MKNIEQMTVEELINYVKSNPDKTAKEIIQSVIDDKKEDKVELWKPEKDEYWYVGHDWNVISLIGDSKFPNAYQTIEEAQEDADYFKALQEWRRLGRLVNESGEISYREKNRWIYVDYSDNYSTISADIGYTAQPLTVWFESKEKARLAYNSLSDSAKKILFNGLPLE